MEIDGDKWIKDTEMHKSVDLKRFRTLAIFYPLIAHDAEKKDLQLSKR